MSSATIIPTNKKNIFAPLSPEQKKFNCLIAQINKQKTLLAQWQDSFNQVRQTTLETLPPLRKRVCEQQIALANLLDQKFTNHKFTNKQQEKLSYLIVELCDEILAVTDDAAIKNLYNKYCGGDYDAEVQEEQQISEDMLKYALEEQFGIKLNDDEFDINNPHSIAEHLFNKFQQHQEQAEAKRSKRKKSTKQLAKEAQQAAEDANVSKSIQAVFRQLTSVLHPDREPDLAERQRKTDLMQQVTVAYSNRDLLKLLELQLAVEKIVRNQVHNIATERLKHYNKILSDQLKEIRDEVLFKENEIRLLLNISPLKILHPAHLILMLKEDIHTLEQTIVAIQRDLALFQDYKQLKAWLGNFNIPESDFDDIHDPFMSFAFKQ